MKTAGEKATYVSRRGNAENGFYKTPADDRSTYVQDKETMGWKNEMEAKSY